MQDQAVQQEQLTEVKPKTYLLLDHTNPTAPVYQRVNKDQRIRIDRLPIWSPYLKMTFMTEKGRNRTARLKLNTNTIWQDEQIQPAIGIPANEPFTDEERRSVQFRNGALTTINPIVQLYLDSIPFFEDFKGKSEYRPHYKIYDDQAEIKSFNSDFRLRLRVGNMIAGLSLEKAQELMIRLNGRSFIPPSSLEKCQNELIEYMDGADQESLEDMIKDELTVDEKVMILVSRAIEAEIISFDKVKDQVVRVDKNRTLLLKEIASSYDPYTREKMFIEFLTSKDGVAILEDLKTRIEKKETPSKETKK